MRPSPVWPAFVGFLGLAACLGDVPPFSGEDPAGQGAAGPGGATDGTGAGVQVASSIGSGGASSTSTSQGGGGAPSTSQGTGGQACQLEVAPTACDDAQVAMQCAFGACESCRPGGVCDAVSVCEYPETIDFATPGPACVNPCGASCALRCDGVGSAFVALGPINGGTQIPLATFGPSSIVDEAFVVRLRARGHGSFRMQWLTEGGVGAASARHELGPDLADFEIGVPGGLEGDVQVQLIFDVDVVGFFVDVDCVFAVPAR